MFGKQHRFGPETVVPAAAVVHTEKTRPSAKHHHQDGHVIAERLIQWGEQMKCKHALQAERRRVECEEAEMHELRTQVPRAKISPTRARRLFESDMRPRSAQHKRDQELVAVLMRESKELAECTFHPTLVAKPQSEHDPCETMHDVFTRLYAQRHHKGGVAMEEEARTFASGQTQAQWCAFLERQDQYREHRQDHLSHLERVYGHSYRPTLSRRSRELAKRHWVQHSAREPPPLPPGVSETRLEHDEAPRAPSTPVSITIAQAETFYQKEERHRKNKQDRQLRLVLERRILERAEVLHQSSCFRGKKNPFSVSAVSRKDAVDDTNKKPWNSSTLFIPERGSGRQSPTSARMSFKTLEESDAWWKRLVVDTERRAEKLDDQRNLLWTASCPFQPKISHRSKLLAEMSTPSS